MKTGAIVLVAAILAGLALAGPAEARHGGYARAAHYRAAPQAVRYARARPTHWRTALGRPGGVYRAAAGAGLGLSAACRQAAAMGGPCGCYAQEILFGTSNHTSLWLANSWLRFPRATPAPGMAAVWPGRHVAVIIASNGNGTVTVNDSWNHAHVVSTRGLVIVDPRGGSGTQVARAETPVSARSRSALRQRPASQRVVYAARSHYYRRSYQRYAEVTRQYADTYGN